MRYFLTFLLLLLAACDQSSQHLALGTLERERIAHTATTNEVVAELPVAPGTPVKKGTLLVKLDDTLQQAQVDKAEAQLAQAQAELDKLRHGARKEDVAVARAKLDGAEASLVEGEAAYQRVRNLKQQNAISQAELDKARAARDAAQAGVQSAQEALLALTAGTREEDLRAAEAALNSASAVLASEKKRLADLSVLATRDGTLDNLPWNLGERVTVGSPLAILLAGKAPYARVYIPEPYRVKLQVGESLAVHVDGIEQPFTGRLSWIATQPAFTPYYALNQEERARLMYLAEVQLPDSAAELPNGVPAQVDLP